MLTQSKINTVERFIARLIAAIGAGALVFFIAAPLAHNWAPLANVQLQIGLGLVTSALTFFVTRNLFNFTADCLDIPTMSPAFQKNRPAGPVKLTATATDKQTPAAIASDDVPATSAAELWTESREDGSLKVRVTVTGLSKREFNMLRGRLENVAGIKWDKPVNLYNRQRKMEGVLPKGTNQAQVLARLQALTGNRV